MLIGVFLENRHLSMDELSTDIVANPRVQGAVLDALSAVVEAVDVLRLYAESRREGV